MRLDPITLEVINHRLGETVSAMEHLLFHSGYSTILRESFDGSAALCDDHGRVVLLSGFPFHFLPYAISIQAIIQSHPVTEMVEGDAFLEADPYGGGVFHVPDQVVATPVFVDGTLLAFCLSLTHKADVGGIVPGSSGAGSREIFHEGLIIPPVRFWTKAGVERDLEALFKRNSRSGDALAGDLRAQVGCTAIGAQRLRALCVEYGTETIRAAFAALLDSTEQRVRAGLARWPDGVVASDAWVDNDGVDVDRPLHLQVRVSKVGDEASIDYSEMCGEVSGPINLRPQASEMAGLMALLTHLDPTLPMNDGFARPVTFINPIGRVTNARWPSPVNNYFGLMPIVYSTIQRALSQFDPTRAVGTVGFGQGAVSFGYRETRLGRQGIQYELLVSSLGGTPVHDGASPVMTMAHVTPNTPVEILESEYPVRVLSHSWLADTAGPGTYRGGPGYRKEYEALGDAVFTLRLVHQFRYPGWGVFGGKAPPVARAFLNRSTPNERALGPLETIHLHPGDTVSVEVPGGGGYGEPTDRPPARVLEDVLDGYVSVEGARRDYGVVLRGSDHLEVDEESTAILRRTGSDTSGGS